MTSMEINAAVGEKVLEAFPETRVDVHNPQDYDQYRDQTYDKYLFREIPDRAVCRLAQQERQCFCSGGIDSPVAGYMIAKRGVVINATYFHATAIYEAESKAEGCRPCKEGCQIFGQDKAACCQFYRYTACHI